MHYLPGNGAYSLGVIDEEQYQPTLIDIAGPYTPDGRSIYLQATLHPSNDGGAIVVQIAGRTVGYISDEDTTKIGKIDNGIIVDAAITGGSDDTYYGVWLDWPAATAPASALTLISRAARRGFAVGFWLNVGGHVLLLLTGKTGLLEAVMDSLVTGLLLWGPICAIIGAIVGAMWSVNRPASSR